jgi:hypothetical protein
MQRVVDWRRGGLTWARLRMNGELHRSRWPAASAEPHARPESMPFAWLSVGPAAYSPHDYCIPLPSAPCALPGQSVPGRGAERCAVTSHRLPSVRRGPARVGAPAVRRARRAWAQAAAADQADGAGLRGLAVPGQPPARHARQQGQRVCTHAGGVTLLRMLRRCYRAYGQRGCYGCVCLPPVWSADNPHSRHASYMCSPSATGQPAAAGSEQPPQGVSARRYSRQLLKGDFALVFDSAHMAGSASADLCFPRSRQCTDTSGAQQACLHPLTTQLPSPSQSSPTCALRPRCLRRPASL